MAGKAAKKKSQRSLTPSSRDTAPAPLPPAAPPPATPSKAVAAAPPVAPLEVTAPERKELLGSSPATPAAPASTAKSRPRSDRKSVGAKMELARPEVKERLKEAAQALKDRNKELHELRAKQTRLEQQVQKAASREAELRETKSELGRQLEELREEHAEAIAAFQTRVSEYERAERELRGWRPPEPPPVPAGPDERDVLIRRLETELAEHVEREQQLVGQVQALSNELAAGEKDTVIRQLQDQLAQRAEREQQLASRIEALSDERASQAKDDFIRQLQEQLAMQTEREQQLIGQIEGLSEEQARNENAAVRQLEDQLARQAERERELASRIERLSERPAAEESDAAVRQLQEQIEMQAERERQLLSQIAALSNRPAHDEKDAVIRQLEEQAAQQAEREQQLAGRIESLSAQLASDEKDARIQQLQEQLAQLAERERELAGQLEAMSTPPATEEKDATIRQLEEQLTRQVEREQRLAGQIEVLSSEHATAMTALTEARQQLEEHREQFQEVRGRFQEYDHERSELLRQISVLEQQAADAEAARPIAPEAPSDAGVEAPIAPTVRVTSPAARWYPLGVAAGAGLLLVGMLLAAASHLLPATQDRIVAYLVVPDAEAGTAKQMIDNRDDPLVAVLPSLRAESDSSTGMLKLSLPSKQPEQDRSHLDELGRKIAADLNREASPPAPATTAPAADDPLAKLAGRFAELSGGLAATASRPAGAPLRKREESIAVLKEVLLAKDRLARQIGDLSAQLAAMPLKPGDIPLDPAKLAKAETDDAKLQADLAALRPREAALSQQLQTVLYTGQAPLEALEGAIGDCNRELQKIIGANAGRKPDAHLAAIGEVLTQWGKTVQVFSEAWNEERRALTGPMARRDSLASLSRLQSPMTPLAEMDTASAGRLQEALTALGDSGAPLARGIQAILDAREQVLTAVRKAGATNEVDLSALAREIADRRAVVERERTAVATRLREEVYNQLRSRRDALAADAAKLDQRIAGLAETLDQETGSDRQEQAAVEKQLAQLRERTAAVQTELSAARAVTRQPALVPPPVSHAEITYIPSHTESVALTSGERVRRASLMGGLPAAVGVLILAALGIVHARQRPRRPDESATSLPPDELPDV